MNDQIDDKLLKWQKFWFYPWEARDPSWDRKYPMLAKLPKDSAFSRLHHKQISSYTQTQICPPLPVNDILLTMTKLNKYQRDMAMVLIDKIIDEHSANEYNVDIEMLHWCRRIAKGLRPGTWFGNDIEEVPSSLGLLLFYQWSKKSGFWDKSRWLLHADYQEDNLECDKFDVTIKSLSLLFGAVFWQASLISEGDV